MVGETKPVYLTCQLISVIYLLGSRTGFIFALDIVAGDRTVPIESHGPAESNGPLFHLTNLHFRRLWWL